MRALSKFRTTMSRDLRQQVPYTVHLFARALLRPCSDCTTEILQAGNKNTNRMGATHACAVVTAVVTEMASPR